MAVYDFWQVAKWFGARVLTLDVVVVFLTCNDGGQGMSEGAGTAIY